MLFRSNTDISSFITNISFTGDGYTSDPGAMTPLRVTVSPEGDLTGGPVAGVFYGYVDTPEMVFLSVNAGDMEGQVYDLSLRSTPIATGFGRWTRISLEAGPVPEPSSLVTLGIGLATIAGLAWRRQRHPR